MKRTVLMVASAVWFAACGHGTQPDDMSARGHREAAAGSEAEAEQHQSQYDPDSRASVASQTTVISDLTYGPAVYNPTTPHLAEAQRLRDLAEDHRRAAASLEAYEALECARFPAQTRAACPLLGQVAALADVDGGVEISLADGVRADAIADHMRCHVAYARTRGREGMDRCPLYVEGASVSSEGALTLTTNAGGEAVEELRRLARAHIAR